MGLDTMTGNASFFFVSGCFSHEDRRKVNITRRINILIILTISVRVILFSFLYFLCRLFLEVLKTYR